ncbi:MAG: hypothetical protein WCE48_06700 [Steroidobacteraceae bacterium]
MRISDDRYSRDRLRFDLALRFIRLEARTSTIRAWTGLTDDRIRKLYRSYVLSQSGTPVPRHRGKSPQQPAFFTRSPRVAEQASALASLCCLLGVLPSSAARDSARTLPGIGRGELLCQAFDCFTSLVPHADISFEHAVYLVVALAQGDELRLSRCPGCRGVVVADRLALREPRCVPCGHQAGSMNGRSGRSGRRSGGAPATARIRGA